MAEKIDCDYKVYFDGQEVSGIYEFALDAFNELSSAADQASQNFSELGNIQKTLSEKI